MHIELRELSVQDGAQFFNMIKEIGPGENGFMNRGHDLSYDEFPAYLSNNIRCSQGIGLKPGYVPQTICWLIINGHPVGYGKLRHYLTDHLLISGGHIGYVIRPSERGKGYGSLILKELLKKAKDKGIDQALLTCDEANTFSRKAIETNQVVQMEIDKGYCRYWLQT